MNKHVLFAAVAATLFAAPVHAIKINDQALTTNGGSLSDIQGTAPNVFDALRTSSNAAQFDAVGRIGDCTGTWLGSEGDYAWVLTAARCVRNTNLVGAADHLTFTNKDGVALAGGEGSASYIHPKRINRPISVRDAGTDIALVRMKRLPASDTAAPVAPVLYNGKAEGGAPVDFVAYGSALVNNTNVNAVWPTEGERRAWGESRLDGVTENGHALFSNFTVGSTTNWAGLTTSDAGSAWWQERNGQWQIVATTSGGNSVQSHAARMSTYASWIKDLFPEARLSTAAPAAESEQTAEITESRGYVSPNQSWAVAYVKAAGQPNVEAPDTLFLKSGEEGATIIRLPLTNSTTGETQSQGFQSHSYSNDTPQGEVGYVVAPNQPGVVGPTTLRRTIERRYTVLTVPTRDAFGNVLDVKLRANRIAGACGRTHMDNPNWCTYERSSSLHVWYDPADNTHLAKHRWQGKLAIDALGWSGPPFQRRIDLEVDIDLSEFKGRITRTAGYDSGNILEGKQVRSNNVYHTVPPQAGAVGPTGPNSSHSAGYYGHTTIVVNARSALTRAIVPIKLRAQRHVQCFNWGQMNYWRECGLWYSPYARMRAWFDLADNPGLGQDRYLGEVMIQSHGLHGGNMIRLDVEIDTLF